LDIEKCKYMLVRFLRVWSAFDCRKERIVPMCFVYIFEKHISFFFQFDKIYVQVSCILHVCYVKKDILTCMYTIEKKISTKSNHKSIFSYRKRCRHANILVWPWGTTFLYDFSENMLKIGKNQNLRVSAICAS